MSRPIILAGPVRSGKTSLCRATFAGRPEVGGVVAPDGEHGRELVDLMTGARTPLEQHETGEATVPVGRFRFRIAAFAWANVLIAEAVRTRPVVVIDEAGPLELRGEGLAEGVTLATAQARTLVLVVRTNLVDAIVERFGLQSATVVTAESWPQLWQGWKFTP